MNKTRLSVRQLQKRDIDPIIQYWLGSDSMFLKGMGVDEAKMPDRDGWTKMLEEQLSHPIEEKNSYCIIWEFDNNAIGHSNVNKIIFGKEAYMHLHIWDAGVRKKGLGTELIKLTLPYFFEKLNLKKLYCEPYALNPAPNKTLEKVGFLFVKKYITIPGWLSFEQPVNLWEMSYDRFKKMV